MLVKDYFFLDTLIVSVLEDAWKILIFCGVEAQVAVQDHERLLEIKPRNCRGILTSF